MPLSGKASLLGQPRIQPRSDLWPLFTRIPNLPRVASPRGPRNHDGTIIPETVHTMWGTDLTTTFTGEGPAAVFIAVDHCSAACVGIHAHARATRFGALKP